MTNWERELELARQGRGVGGDEAAPPTGIRRTEDAPAKTEIEWTDAPFDDSAARVCPVVTTGCSAREELRARVMRAFPGYATDAWPVGTPAPYRVVRKGGAL